MEIGFNDQNRVFERMRTISLPPHIGCATTLTLGLVYYSALFAKLYFVLLVYQQASEGCVKTHGCGHTVLLQYPIDILRDLLVTCGMTIFRLVLFLFSLFPEIRGTTNFHTSTMTSSFQDVFVVSTDEAILTRNVH